MDQRFSRIKGLSEIRRLPRLGKIRLGIKKLAKSGKEYPAEVSYFVVPPEVAQVYGDQPKELDVMFPTEDEHMVFPQAYKWYVSQGLRCKGNGETAMRRFADLANGNREPIENGTTHKPDDLVEVACPCPLLESGECSQAANLMLFLPKVSLGGVYQIDTGSFHNIVRVNSAMDLIRSVAGHISLVPLKLIRQEEEIQYEGKKAKHYLLQLVLNANLSEIAQMRDNSRMIVTRAERLVLPSPVEDGPEPTGPAPTEVVKAAQDVGLLPPPSDLVLPWLEQFKEAETIEQLEAIWEDATSKDRGLWKLLTMTDKQCLQLAKDDRKQQLETLDPDGSF